MDDVQLMVAVDRPLQRIRVKLKVVKFAAERTTLASWGRKRKEPRAGNEVLRYLLHK